jgi:teichuronic acid biosynthesis protein TuaE
LLALEVNKGNGNNFSPGVFLTWLWLLTIATAFFGPLLALNNYPGLFAYKILFAVHLIAFSFLLATKKIELRMLPRLKPYFLFFAVWLGWALLSLLWADNKMDGIYNIWYLFSGLSLASFSAVYIRKGRELKVLTGILVAVFLLVLGVGLWETRTGLHLKTAGEVLNLTGYARYMPRGFFKNPNDMATYLVLYLPFVYTLARYCCRKLITAPLLTVLLPAAGLGVFLILQSGSRANMLALVPMALAAVVLYFIHHRIKALLNTTVLLIITVMAYFMLTTSTPEFAYWCNRQYRIATHHLSTLQYAGGAESARVVLLKNSINELKDHALMGVGAGNAEEHMKKYRTATFVLLALHNWWLEILVNYGVFVFILYLIFYVKLLYELFLVTVRAGPGILQVLGEGCLLALVAFPIAAISSSSLIYARFMWILFGIALCVVNNYHLQRLKGEEGGRM